VANLHSVLILGPDAIAAASPATGVQLAHACRHWGFSTVAPSSWGDELVAAEVIRQCAWRQNRPAIQCSCPRVADTLGKHAELLEEFVLWLDTPPVATAKYIRAHAGGRAVHITYAGGCPGAVDSSIDQRITPSELLQAISTRGIDLASQPTVFEDVVPPDRRRHFSAPAGTPDFHQLWEASAFRIERLGSVDPTIGVAHLLLSEQRILVDMAPTAGCVCRGRTDGVDAVTRSPTPVVRHGVIDVLHSRPSSSKHHMEAHAQGQPLLAGLPGGNSRATVQHDFDGGVESVSLATDRVATAEAACSPSVVDDPDPAPPTVAPTSRRHSPSRPGPRRQSAWRLSVPTSVAVAVRKTGDGDVMLLERAPLLARPEVRFAIGTAFLVTAMMFGMWMGRRADVTASDPGRRAAQRASVPPNQDR
jgi:hypothetical protein